MSRRYLCSECGKRHGPGECQMVSDPKKGAVCPQCGNALDPNKRNQGHKGTCPVILALDDPRNQRANPPRPGVRIPQHKGPWSRPGSVYTNEYGLRFKDFTCKTCGRTATTLASASEPTSFCPEIRGRKS